LVIVLAIAGFVFGREAAQGQLLGQIEGLVGPEGGKAIETMVAKGGTQPGSGTLATILGVIMLLVGAAGLFGQLQDALNTIWEVQPKPGRGIWGFVQDRFLSFTMVLGSAFLLLVSLVISAALAAIGGLFGDWQTGVVGQAVNQLISLAVITLLFAMIFKFLPDAKIAWRDVWLGAVITAILFTLGKFLIGLYLGHSSVGSVYGGAGSLAVLLIWLYYSSQIFLFGAEFTKVYANRFGSRIVPAKNAEPVTEEARAQQGIPHSQAAPAGAAH
jgi:membrane protein